MHEKSSIYLNYYEGPSVAEPVVTAVVGAEVAAEIAIKVLVGVADVVKANAL